MEDPRPLNPENPNPKIATSTPPPRQRRCAADHPAKRGHCGGTCEMRENGTELSEEEEGNSGPSAPVIELLLGIAL